MGARTLTQLVASGLAKAGRTDLTTLATQELKNWLRDQYRAWPWPFLQKRKASASLAAGATSLAIGGGNGGVTNGIITIHDPVYIYTSDYNTRSVVRIRALTGGPSRLDLDVLNPATSTGLPSYFKMRPGSVEGAWNLIPDVIPDKAYLLALDYTEMPADLASGDTPIFPSDRIMEKVVQAFALDYQHKFQEAQMLEGVISDMILGLKSNSGGSPGFNDSVGLDPETFG